MEEQQVEGKVTLAHLQRVFRADETEVAAQLNQEVLEAVQQAAMQVGFGVTGLSDSRVVQPGLFVSEADVVREKRERVSHALDAIRGKLDGGVIGFGGAARD